MTKVGKIRRREIKGEKRGGELGYPTAKLELLPEDDIKRGIWATMVEIEGRKYPSATFVGAPVSFDDDQEKIEVYVFGYKGDLYDKMVELEFVEWLRPVEKFDSENELVQQIKKDCLRARDKLQ